MTFDRTHLLLQWGGTLLGGEIWSNSLRMAGPNLGNDPIGIIPHDQVQSWLEGEVKSEVSTWHSSAGASIHSSCKLTYVKLNYIDINGHYYDPTTHEYVYPTPVAGATSSPLLPSQCCVVVSLVTGLDRGWAHRGRFYSPAPAITLSPVDGLMDTTKATSIGAAAKVFLESLSDYPGLDPPTSPNAVVMSAKGTGATHPVTGVEIGRVIDTQRRRRNALKEQYVLTPVDLGAA